MSDEWPGRPWFQAPTAQPAPAPERLASFRIPHRMDIGGEWASLLAEVDERCGAETASRIDALVRMWVAQKEGAEHEQGEDSGE